jgi:hydroxysqualene dehydroxylase
MNGGRVHVIGAGLAGLSAAVDLVAAGRPVVVHEASPQAGGRCRSYFDATIDMEIDNGNHLVLSGNRATLAYARRIGAREKLVGPGSATFPFIDLSSGRRWTLRANDGLLPFWMLTPSRRVPDTRLVEYLELAKLLLAGRRASIADTLACRGPLWEQLIEPFLIAALNIEAPAGSAALAGRVVRETLAAGGRNYHPLVAAEGLSNALVRPALDYVQAHGGTVAFGRRLRGFAFADGRATGLDFGDERIDVGAGESVVLATPPQVTGPLLPDVSTPTEFRAIVNAHYRVAPPPGLPPITGIVGGLAQWLFAFPGRLSVTISAGDAWLDTPREELARRIWADVAKVAGLSGEPPRWQIVRERRATFAATPEQDTLRPGHRTAWRNLVLAGDWTQTGLPATIEGAVRSGLTAAKALLAEPVRGP